MQTLFTVLSIILSVNIVALHVLSVIFSDKISKIINFVNIALHILLIFAMLPAGAALELVALVFMFSLLVYVIAYAVRRRCTRKEGEE